jgi:hypothetical protein
LKKPRSAFFTLNAFVKAWVPPGILSLVLLVFAFVIPNRAVCGCLEGSAVLFISLLFCTEPDIQKHASMLYITNRSFGKIRTFVRTLAEILEKPMSDLQYQSWQRPLQDAIDEADLQKLPEKVAIAETAIFQRMQELVTSPDGNQESAAIREACKELLKIQTQRLKWPATDGMLADC